MSLVPKIRFKEFKGNWVDKKLDGIAMINPPTKKRIPDGFFYIDLECVEKGILKHSKYIQKNDAPSRAQRILESNDILFQMVRPYQKNNLFFNNGSNYVASTGYAQLRTKECAQFLYQLLHTNSFVDQVLLRCTGTSYPAINTSDLSTIPIHIPTLAEQKKIANFLTTIDDKLEALKEKEKLLKEYKQGVVEKIFNQEIRFKKDDGSNFTKWEETELSNIAKIYQSKTISQSQFVSNGLYLVYGANGVIGRYNQYNHEQKQVIVSCRGSCGNVHFTRYKSWITGNAMVINMDETLQCEKKFIYYQLSNTNFNYLITGSGQPQITSNIKNHKVFIPTLEEQQKIASFLTTIDEKIALLTSQIENTENYKQGLLQQMFI